jgi:hypothetical protein
MNLVYGNGHTSVNIPRNIVLHDLKGRILWYLKCTLKIFLKEYLEKNSSIHQSLFYVHLPALKWLNCLNSAEPHYSLGVVSLLFLILLPSLVIYVPILSNTLNSFKFCSCIK